MEKNREKYLDTLKRQLKNQINEELLDTFHKLERCACDSSHDTNLLSNLAIEYAMKEKIKYTLFCNTIFSKKLGNTTDGELMNYMTLIENNENKDILHRLYLGLLHSNEERYNVVRDSILRTIQELDRPSSVILSRELFEELLGMKGE